MSNLYKQRCIVSDNENKRVINSNTRMEKKMDEIARSLREHGKVEPGFVPGLNPEEVEVEPKEELTLEELGQRSREEAEQILSEARAQAEQVLSEAKTQAENQKVQAKEEGYAQGLKEGQKAAQQELAQQKKRLEEAQEAMEEKYSRLVEELEPKLVDVITEVFEKVFHVQFEDKKEILLYLIQNTLSGIEGTKEFQVRVGNEDYEYLEGHKHEITERVGQNISVEIMADSNLKQGQCMIETDSGVFDCGTDVQLENLIKALRSLSL